jgi:hypothetical protein
MIAATYTLAEDEFYEAMIEVMRIREPGQFRKRSRQIAELSLLALLVPFTVVYFWLKIGNLTWISPGTLVALICYELWLAYILCGAITFRGSKKAIHKLFQRAVFGQTNVHLQIDESGWHDYTPGTSTSSVKWGGFSNWVETDRMFIVLQRATGFNMVPKRVLAPEQLNQLRQLVGTRVAATPPS